ncbi:TIGR00266 family protein [Salidesulfovibrio onnuriiensis]|uniref:TIGR00266 family protein n=1 Tax=Salidesulfovibrio onnuriiensis TaxID=2583823 RepID=UPI0011C8FE9A|nr:TIGR00266 family protein [Salidesulfovibrio onnuriiensis]
MPRCHEVDYTIHGDDLQLVEVILDPGETVIAEAGAMVYMEDGINFETRFGDGSADQGMLGKLFSAGKRMLTGESLFITHFTNESDVVRKVAFAAPTPGKIVPVDMSTLPGNTIQCQRDAFLCAAKGTRLEISLTKKLGAGFFGGEGFILQKLHGDGIAFFSAGGTVVPKELKGESLRVDTGCLVAFTEGIDYSIQAAGGLRSMLFGGEGIFLATLRGTGTVWVQSMPFAKLAEQIISHLPKPE